MRLIQLHSHEKPAPEESVIALLVDRTTLAKRRWRGTAGDGREFGFDLDHPLSHGVVFYRDEGACYAVFQAPEPVLEIPLPASPREAASLAWQIGNLHFSLEFSHDVIRTVDDDAIRQLLDRENISYGSTNTVFRPATAAAHGHHHH